MTIPKVKIWSINSLYWGWSGPTFRRNPGKWGPINPYGIGLMSLYPIIWKWWEFSPHVWHHCLCQSFKNRFFALVMASRCCNPSWKMQAAISVVNPVLKHVKNSSISHRRRRSPPGFILEFVLICRSSLQSFRFWGKLRCEMCRNARRHTSHTLKLWDITCARQTRKKDETRMPFSGGILQAIENSWHVLEQRNIPGFAQNATKRFPYFPN